MNDDQCRLCLSTEQLCESHIIPEGLFSSLYDEKHRMIGVAVGAQNKRAEFLQKGFREALLCQNCETFMNREYEHYGIDTFRKIASQDFNDPLHVRRIQDKENEGIIIGGIDYKRFKLFLLSILWRASVSNREEFNQIELGEHNDIIRQMILNGNPEERFVYPFIVFMLTGEIDNTILSPAYVPIEDISCYQFVFCNLFVWFAVTNQRPNERLFNLSLTEDGTITTSTFESTELPILKNAAAMVREARIPNRMREQIAPKKH